MMAASTPAPICLCLRCPRTLAQASAEQTGGCLKDRRYQHRSETNAALLQMHTPALAS
ncbi:hypothetical protein XHV734_3879 [Xanthomonas hortorum pv. vitians]|nr:hypothetical protein XHV734_3879 [Xanthomonas hortorum pv. vitians]